MRGSQNERIPLVRALTFHCWVRRGGGVRGRGCQNGHRGAINGRATFKYRLQANSMSIQFRFGLYFLKVFSHYVGYARKRQSIGNV